MSYFPTDIPFMSDDELKENGIHIPKEAHGHWIDVGSLSCRCDQCGCKNNKQTRFCPNCGAKMDAQGEE